MKRFFLVSFFLAFLISGCHREDQHPELRDPVYEDIYHQLQNEKHELSHAKKKLALIKMQLSKAKPRTIDRMNDKMRLQKEKAVYQKLYQGIAYEKLRVKRRRVDDRLSYKLAFIQHKPWPDPKEYKRYLLSKRLSDVAKHWRHPVPDSYPQ